AWYWYGKLSSDVEDGEQAERCFRRALELNPYLNAAREGLRACLMLKGAEPEAKKLIEEAEALNNDNWESAIDTHFWCNLGRYALVTGRVPEQSAPKRVPRLPLFVRNEKLQIQLAAGARWATAGDFGTGPVAELRAAVRKRFGGVVAVLDYNGDGKPD